MSPRYLAALLGLGALWGSTFLFIKVVVDETTPLQVAGGRVFLGAAALVPIVWLRGLRLSDSHRIVWRVLVLAVFSSAIPFFLISWAQQHIDSGVTSVLICTMPLWTAVFALVFLADEHLTPATVLGLLVGFGGVAVLSGDDLRSLRGDSALGHVAVVCAAASYGASAVFARAHLQAEDRVTITAAQLAMATLLLAPFSLAVDGLPALRLSAKVWLALLTLGAVHTGFAIVIFYWLIQRVGSVRTSLVNYMIPTVGLLLGASVLDEELGLSALLGAGLIVMGVATAAGGSRLPLLRRRLPETANAPLETPGSGE